MSVSTKAWAILDTRTGKFHKKGKLWTRLSSIKSYLPYCRVWNSNRTGYSDRYQYPSTMDGDIIVEYEVVEKRRRSLKDFVEDVYPLDQETLIDALREVEKGPTKKAVVMVVATADVQKLLDLIGAAPHSSPAFPFLRGAFRGYPIYEDPCGEPGIVRVEKSSRNQRKLRLPND